MWRRSIVIAGIALLLIGTLIGGFAVWRWATGSTEFDPAQWKTQTGTDCFDMSRWEMVDDLRSNHLRLGMTTREVRRLLGAPDYNVGADLRGRGVWWDYLTGPDLVDCSTLGVRFRNGRLEETAIGQT